eukprot:GEZU01001204.1.p1 GENE.GEZU01001204.1~~GEZU01001204.1.p1  ORF type:complete len:114 (+),score=45.60 GEZU01001204.1:159-500(+)
MQEYDQRKKRPAIYKDLDLDRKLVIGKQQKDKLMDQITKDCQFLENHHIMDYSFLVGIHFSEDDGNDTEHKKKVRRFARLFKANPLKTHKTIYQSQYIIINNNDDDNKQIFCR